MVFSYFVGGITISVVIGSGCEELDELDELACEELACEELACEEEETSEEELTCEEEDASDDGTEVSLLETGASELEVDSDAGIEELLV